MGQRERGQSEAASGPVRGSVAADGSSAIVAPDAARGQEVLLRLGMLGVTLSAALGRHLGAEDLVGNATVMILCDLALNGPRRPRDVQRISGLSSGGVTKVLDRLEGHGLIKRTFGTVPGDRRASLIVLTEAGADLASGMADEVTDRRRDLRASLAAIDALLRP